jgi:hypothetical protein
MNLPIPSKKSCDLFVLLAAVLLHANHVLAAEPVGDGQMQARDLLSGTVGGRAKIESALPANSADGHQIANLDPQEQARQLILGRRTFGAVAEPNAGHDSKAKVTATAPTGGKRRELSDARELARRMILGVGV